MKIPFSLIAVFTDSELGFTGNTTAVLLTDQQLSESTMKKMAADFNQPATTFLWPGDTENTFKVRWLAPDEEIGLCGHGSLAAIAFLANQNELTASITLVYRGGEITGYKNNDGSCSIELGAIPVMEEQQPSQILKDGLGIPVMEYHTTNNKHIVVVGSESELAGMKPDFAKLRESEVFGYTVTAPGQEVDFVSRTLVPHVQQLEDPATGSSHAALAPFWSNRLGKSKMQALQLSKRGGRFNCEVKGNMVTLTGNYSFFAEGTVKY